MTAGPQVPDPAQVAAAITEAGRIEREQAGAHALAAWHGRAEFERGRRQGRAEAAAEAAATAAEAIAAVRAAAEDVDLMKRRWGPGGRDNFGAPRTGDFQGRDRAFRPPGHRPPVHQPQRCAEPEREAG